jgi:hypothetical protein
MSSLVFRKTESGKAEIATRQAGLAPAMRQLLILVNGVDSVQALQAKGLGDVRAHLDTLLAVGLIEPVPAAPRPVAVSPPPQAASRPPPALADAPVFEEDHRVLDAQRLAMQRLVPHFGPDTVTVAQSLLAERTVPQYLAALEGIQAKLAIYMGRKQAEREVQALRIHL